MPVPDLTPLANITEEDILEFVHGETSPRTDSFGVDVADLTMTYKVPGSKLVGFLMWMLGVDYVDSLNKLRRTTPAFHPVHNWAFCKSVQVVGQGFDGDDVALLKWDFQNTPAKWKQYVATCTFEMVPYSVLMDDEITLESERFLSKELIPRVELVSIDNGQVVYEADATDDRNGRPHYSLGLVTRRQTAGVRLTWHRVPLVYVQQDDDDLPQKLMDVQGCVNYGTFLRQTPETMLCTDVRLKKYVSPLATASVGSMYFMLDIEIDFLRLKQRDSEMGKTGETRRGHNCLLASRMDYLYARNAATLRPIFTPLDFSKIFTHWSDAL